MADANIPRTSLAEALPPGDPGLAKWATTHYDRLGFRVQTPHGLTGPVRLWHGGCQGDSGDVGLYSAVGILRTNAHVAIVHHQLKLGSRVVSSPHVPTLFQHPAVPNAPLFELSFSDDRRLLAPSLEAAAYLLDIVTKSCWAAGGQLNKDKLRGVRIVRRGGFLRLQPGTIPGTTGSIESDSSPLTIVGYPVIPGHLPPSAIQGTLARLDHLAHALRRLGPPST